MSSPARYAFQIYQGQTWKEPLLLKNADGSAMNLTAYSARMQIREFVESSSVIMTLDGTNGRLTVTTPLAGEITLSVTAADTAALPLAYDIQTWVYDLEIFIPEAPPAAEIVFRVLEGGVIAYPEVTRV